MPTWYDGRMVNNHNVSISIQGREARELPDWSDEHEEGQMHLYRRLRARQGIHRPRHKQTHTLQVHAYFIQGYIFYQDSHFFFTIHCCVV